VIARENSAVGMAPVLTHTTNVMDDRIVLMDQMNWSASSPAQSMNRPAKMAAVSRIIFGAMETMIVLTAAMKLTVAVRQVSSAALMELALMTDCDVMATLIVRTALMSTAVKRLPGLQPVRSMSSCARKERVLMTDCAVTETMIVLMAAMNIPARSHRQCSVIVQENSAVGMAPVLTHTTNVMDDRIVLMDQMNWTALRCVVMTSSCVWMASVLTDISYATGNMIVLMAQMKLNV